jgi:hypothetical protein
LIAGDGKTRQRSKRVGRTGETLSRYILAPDKNSGADGIRETFDRIKNRRVNELKRDMRP